MNLAVCNVLSPGSFGSEIVEGGGGDVSQNFLPGKSIFSKGERSSLTNTDVLTLTCSKILFVYQLQEGLMFVNVNRYLNNVCSPVNDCCCWC